MKLGLLRPTITEESQSPSPARPHHGRLTALTLLLTGACIGMLAVNGAGEQARVQESQTAQLLTGAVLGADRMDWISQGAISRDTEEARQLRPRLEAAVPEQGAAYILSVDRRAFIGAGEGRGFSLTLRDLSPFNGNTGPISVKGANGQNLVGVARALPGGQTYVSVNPEPKGAWRVWLPYGGAAIAVCALAAAFLRLRAQYRFAVAGIEGEKNALLSRAL